MGIGEWFGFGKQEEEPAAPIPRVPTADDLLTAVDRVEALAREGKVPGLVMARLRRVTETVRQTVPRLDRVGQSSLQGYSVMATATDYLPEAIGGYLRLPRQWADTRPVDRGKTSLMILVDQLDLLGATMDKVFDAINRADAEALVVHGRFLQEKFGHASTGGQLAIGGEVPLTPMPTGQLASPAPAGAASTAGPAAGAGSASEPDIRLQPPLGR